MTGTHLPCVGEELYFRCLGRSGPGLTVTGVQHTFRHAYSAPAATWVDTATRPQPHTIAAAQRLLVDSAVLITWAEELPAVRAEPVEILVKLGALYLQRHPHAAADPLG